LTPCNEIGHLEAQPVLFSLGMIKGEMRSSPNLWRLLGILPAQPMSAREKQKSKQKEQRKLASLEFYHNCLEVILWQ